MFTVSIKNLNIKLSAPPGALLMNILIKSDVIHIDYPCGGLGICGKCKLKIRTPNGWKQVSACQTRVYCDLDVELAENDINAVVCVDAVTSKRTTLNPSVEKIFIPFLGRDSVLSWEELCARLEFVEQIPVTNIKVVRDLSYYTFLKEGFTVVLYAREVLSLEPGDTRQSLYGMAFDIGTTTIAGYLFNLTDGALLTTLSGLNTQIKYGADIITRIAFAEQTESGLKTLQNDLTTFINEHIGQAADLAGVNRRDIYDLVFVGNPCIQHLFLGINPRSLGRAPYQPILRQPITIAANNAGIEANEAAKVHWLPGVAGFVGADTIGMLISNQIDCDNKIVLAVDIGTNDEMVLWDGNNMWACSTAAGPAFEGVSMTCGVRAQNGAIDKVELSGNKTSYSVIGSGLPVGICGSGFFPAIAAMINSWLVDESGKMALTKDGDA